MVLYLLNQPVSRLTLQYIAEAPNWWLTKLGFLDYMLWCANHTWHSFAVEDAMSMVVSQCRLR